MTLRPRSQAGLPEPSTGHTVEPGLTAAPGTEPGFRPAPFAPSEPGTVVEATWGEELFQPFPYTTFRVGPFKATGVVRPGESVAEAVFRLWCALNESAMRIREEQTAGYLKAAVDLKKTVSGPLPR